MTEESIEIVLAVDGRPTVLAEPLYPREWALGVHPHPWAQEMTGCSHATPPIWCVTDSITGLPVAIEPKRVRAITSAIVRLAEEAAKRDCTIPQLLADLRRPFLH
jgi:hypothetical protein